VIKAVAGDVEKRQIEATRAVAEMGLSQDMVGIKVSPLV
jgi:hypothetical protein